MTYRRPSETLYEETENTPEKNGQEWLLLYDFKGTKPGTKFYTNLTRISTYKGKMALIQYSPLITSSRRVALAAKKPAIQYGAETTVLKVVRRDS